MTQPDWDDGRLEAAFRAKFDRPAPPSLEKDVHVRIAGTSPARLGALQRGGPGWGLAAAAVVVVLVGAVTVGLSASGRQGGSPPPSDPGTVATPGASATPTEQAVPGSMLGLEIIHVSDAIAIRDAGVGDRELAVMGWFTPAPLISCGGEAMKVFASPVQIRCPDQLIWLTQDAESLFLRTGNRSNSVAPQGPALNPDLEGLDWSWFPDLPVVGQDGGSTPVDVVFIGHFDDRRAALCPEAEVAACRDRFVVDSVARVHGVEPPRSVTGPTSGSTKSTVADIEAIVGNEAPQSPILSMTVVDVHGLVTIEPSLANGQHGLIGQPILWIVRVLESERIATYIVVDGTHLIYEMNAGGDAIEVGGPAPPAPTSTAGPWPPADAVVIALTSEVDAGKPPVRVAVVDRSGRLVAVTEKGAVDPSALAIDGRFGAYAEPGTPGRVHLSWIGGICDSQITVTVAADLRTIAFDMGPQPDCDTIGVGRQLVLDFTGSVDVPAIELRDAATATASPRGYTLDCGPLGPDTCETKAAAIVAANLRGSPPKRVVSIRFETECGSFTAILDDGSGVGADIDCILTPDPS